jgi:hypothetical protein
MGHPKAFEAATKIARHTPGYLKHIFFGPINHRANACGAEICSLFGIP